MDAEGQILSVVRKGHRSYVMQYGRDNNSNHFVDGATSSCRLTTFDRSIQSREIGQSPEHRASDTKLLLRSNQFCVLSLREGPGFSSDRD